MNPCPCGNYMDPTKTCTCPSFKVQNYWSKLSGPLLDRIDLHVEVPRLKKEELIGTKKIVDVPQEGVPQDQTQQDLSEDRTSTSEAPAEASQATGEATPSESEEKL